MTFPLIDVKLPYGSFTFKTEKGSDNYNNFIRYQKKGKTIIILPNDLKNKITFDFIDERNFPVKENNTIKEIVFLVGKKDKNNQLKYGLYSNVRKQIVDFIYDEFKNIQFYFNDGKMLFKIKQNDKYGLIQTDGTILLPTNFKFLCGSSHRFGNWFITELKSDSNRMKFRCGSEDYSEKKNVVYLFSIL